MENLDCPECGKSTMFENRANGLTCSNKDCEAVIFSCTANESRKMQCLIRSSKDVITAQGDMIKRYEEIVKLMNERMALLEAKLKAR